jgi:hypothetical protein
VSTTIMLTQVTKTQKTAGKIHGVSTMTTITFHIGTTTKRESLRSTIPIRHRRWKDCRRRGCVQNDFLVKFLHDHSYFVNVIITIFDNNYRLPKNCRRIFNYDTLFVFIISDRIIIVLYYSR